MSKTEVERIARQLHRAFHGHAWHGPSVEEVLSGVTAPMASAASPGGVHTIWQITLHIGVWEQTALRWLRGDLIHQSQVDAWPTIAEISEAAWHHTVANLCQSNQQLHDEILTLDDERLGQRVFLDSFTVYTLLHGVVQHDLYHAGQIALLKRLQSPRNQ
jgi:hypothetical protein